jgi:hypothetical protein
LKENNKRHDKYENVVIYQLQCMDRPQYYIGQTGRSFNIRYKENIRDIKNNNDNIGYTHHIINNKHKYGNIQDTMKILHITQKGRFMNTIENYHI